MTGALLILALTPLRSAADFTPPPEMYRADALDPVRAGPPGDVQVLPQRGSGRWPSARRAGLERRILLEWPEGRVYGRLHSAVALWLRYPLVTAVVSGRVLVPVVGQSALAIEGALEPLRTPRPRRIVVLVDASASGAAHSPVHSGGQVKSLSLLEIQLRALEEVVELAGAAPLEIGVIAFGDETWPVARPGSANASLRRRLRDFQRSHPQADGRRDAVCALWTAYEWLEATPESVEREILWLTDGRVPHSGRFSECERSAGAGGSDPEACRRAPNRSRCPAERRLRELEGSSDVVQLARFARETRAAVRVTPVIWELGPDAKVYERLARRTGSRALRVASPDSLATALPALAWPRLRGVYARNLTSGARSANLLEEDARFLGALPLRPGANDVELRVESERGTAALFHFRVYSEVSNHR